MCAFAGFDLDDKTFRTLWQDYQSTGGIDYDEFVAVLTKLQILRGDGKKIYSSTVLKYSSEVFLLILYF